MLNDMWIRLRSIFRRDVVESELDDEMRFHFEQQVEKFVKAGMTREEARRRARLEFGGIDGVKEECRDARRVHLLETIFQDVRYGLRMLRKSPGFTIVAALTLALGIGANTAVFSVLNAVMLRQLPVERPGELYSFGTGRQAGSTHSLPDSSWQLFSYPFFRQIRQQSEVFSGVAAIHSIEFSTHGSVNGGGYELIHADLVSGNYFSVLGVNPVLGRTLTDADDQTPGAGPVAVASYSWWKRRFGGDPSILGKNVKFEATIYTIVGVAPAEFFGTNVGQSPELWIPLSMEKEISPGWNGLDNKFFQTLYLFGRLRPGVTREQASANINLRFKRILRSEYVGPQPSQEELDAIQHAQIDLTPMSRGLSHLRGEFALSLKILMSIVGLVLLIACANIANLLLARGTARSREIAMRMAIGASRPRLIRQLATESLLLAVLGTALGLLLSWQAPELLLRLTFGTANPIALDVSPDARVLLFTLLVTLAATLLFGMAPALRATRIQMTTAFQDGRSAGSAPMRGPLAKALLVSQIALSLVLLTGMGLFLRSLANLLRVDTGFDPQHVLDFNLDEYAAGYQPDARLANAMTRIEERVRGIPGVRSAGFGMFTFNQGNWSGSVVLEGIPATSENDEEVLMNRVSPGFLDAMGLPVLVGRTFAPEDSRRSQKVALINEKMARDFFPGESPIGHRFGTSDDPKDSGEYEIIGVVKNAKYMSLEEKQYAAAYALSTQDVTYLPNFVVRYVGDAGQMIAEVRQAISEAASDIPIGSISTLAEQVDNSINSQRLVAQLTSFFGALAIFLVCIGVYGLMSYTVARRTNEIGIRMALGAERSAILSMIFRESLSITAIGLVIGVLGSLALTRLLAGFLYGVQPNDPVSIAAAITLLVIVSLAACYIPARRATRVDPMVALRYE